jgi:hypothetical protein
LDLSFLFAASFKANVATLFVVGASCTYRTTGHLLDFFFAATWPEYQRHWSGVFGLMVQNGGGE